MKEIVKYHNDFNKIKLPGFTELEQNLLVTILVSIKDTPAGQEKFIGLDLLQKAFVNDFKNNAEIGEYLTSLRDKFFKADFEILVSRNGLNGIQHINLFNKFTFYYDEPNAKPKKEWKNFYGLALIINPDFEYLLNQVTQNFTRFELVEFISLSGKYTKTLYRLLKQYRTTGYFKMEWQEFVCVMDISENKTMGDIDKFILKPAIKELTKSRNLFDQERIPFEKLTYTKLKGKGRGRGGKVIGIEFSFKPQPTEAIEQKDIYTDFAEKHQGKIFFFEKFGKFEFKGLGRNQEQERIFVFDNELQERINDKVSNYPTQKSLNDLAKKIVN